jgi:hypothetical protein
LPPVQSGAAVIYVTLSHEADLEFNDRLADRPRAGAMV